MELELSLFLGFCSIGHHTNLLEYEGIVAELRADPVVWNDASAELASDGVAGEPEHVDLNEGANVLVGQELPGQDL